MSALSLAIGVASWEAVGQLTQFPFLPPISQVVERFFELSAAGVIWENLLTSLGNLVIGFGVAMVLGVGVGMLMGAYEPVDAALEVYVHAFMTAPPLVFAPIFFSIFGLGQASVIAVVVLYSVFVILVNTASAIKGAPRSLVEMAKSFGANERQLITAVLLPSAMPLIMAGVRLGMGRAVKGMINGEMLIAVVGLGAVVMNAGRQFDAAGVLAILLLVIAVALVTGWGVQFVDQRINGWLPEARR